MYVSYAVSPEVVGLISDPDRSSMRYVLKDALLDGPFDLPYSGRHGVGSVRWT